MTAEKFFENFGHLADAPNGVKKLRKLILQLAVQGKLVPQDSNNEPVMNLVEESQRRKKQRRQGRSTHDSMRQSRREAQSISAKKQKADDRHRPAASDCVT